MSRDLRDTEPWILYERGKDHHNLVKLYSESQKAYNFYEDRQWQGVEAGGETLPFYNIIKPIIKYKTASVAMNYMAITFTNMNNDDEIMVEACKNLDKFVEQKWEKSKMDSLKWLLIKRANIVGDDYLYLYDGGNKAQLIDNVNIYLADEQMNDLQRQPYILIYERLQVRDVKKIAEENGLDPDMIMADEEDRDTLNEEEVKTLEGKCTSIMKLWKDETGIVNYSKSTRTLIYDEGKIDGLTHYPLVSLVIEPLHNSSRGLGEVRPLIANQIEINKTLYRRSVAVKNVAFPQIVYDDTKIMEPDKIGQSGLAIAMHGSVSGIRDAITYLQPNGISGDAANLENEMISITKDLAGAGEAALGQTDPTEASGAAIIAVRDQASIPLNETINSYKQFVEDYANVLYAMIVAYNPNGIEFEYTDDTGNTYHAIIDEETLVSMNPDIKIDVSNANPFSKYAQEMSLQNLFTGGYITFEEYIEALDDSSSVPKNKIKALLKKREAMQQAQPMNPQMAMSQTQQMAQPTANEAATAAAMMMNGGNMNAM